MGKLDNTLIIYISGDNGCERRGHAQRHAERGRAVERRRYFRSTIRCSFYQFWGSDKTYPHMAVGWAWAFDTPFKWTKQVASHFGGTRQGMAIAWPDRIKDAGGMRTQFHHVIDVVPTILEATGIPAPDTINGIKQNPIEGVSMAYTWDKANADAPVEAHDAVLRDARQPRHLPRRLDCRDDAGDNRRGQLGGDRART